MSGPVNWESLAVGVMLGALVPIVLAWTAGALRGVKE
jgi:hypothetical protein